LNSTMRLFNAIIESELQGHLVASSQKTFVETLILDCATFSLGKPVLERYGYLKPIRINR